MRKIGLLKKVVSITGIMTLFLVSGCGAKQEEPESVLPVMVLMKRLRRNRMDREI